ncbi:hypothetical protein AbraIFM66951_006349 [Aspergillus brasiliensis]|uniref:Uncharacterized protein n=1 Tax=Aspergillus brasiliensis TaxID=319629 RepID=A0A9W5YJ25_9EURO|nr:hypothetical protein AbraCBS73388_004242 [Aspergillus brasiliensis]GKZ40816.1 hypothetical protein AbraIFM66951_006349 [Aspergillus brasiliensis]
MSQFTFFPNMHWRGVTLHFPQTDLHSLLPSQTEKPKPSEASDTFTQEEAEKSRQFPLADAGFEGERRELTLNFKQKDLHSLPPSSWTEAQNICEEPYTIDQEEAERTGQLPLADAGFEGERRELTLNFKQKDLHSLPPSSWTVTRKISEASDSYTQEDAECLCQFPVADARFECANVENPNNKAILEVYMEIPCVDTQGPAEGTYGTPYSVETILEAHKLLTLHDCKYSPGLIQYMEGTQSSEDRRFLMPGGKIYYMVIDKLPGVALGNRLISYTEDGRMFREGLFWTLPRIKRDHIRAAFEVAYLYIQGEFRPLLDRKLDDYGPTVLDLWGLAIAPKGDVDYTVPMDKLEQHGWLL